MGKMQNMKYYEILLLPSSNWLLLVIHLRNWEIKKQNWKNVWLFRLSRIFEYNKLIKNKEKQNCKKKERTTHIQHIKVKSIL